MEQHYFLALQGSYKNSALALSKDQTLLAEYNLHSQLTSAQLLPNMIKILAEHKLTLSNISRIAVDCGPGAFTSLRVILTTANALTWAGGPSLYAFNGLHELINQITSGIGANYKYVAGILNAYSQEAFLAIWNTQTKQWAIQATCLTLSETNEQLSNLDGSCLLVGHTLDLCSKMPDIMTHKHITILQDLPDQVSSSWLALQAWHKFKNNEPGLWQAEPLYLKAGFKKM